MSPEDPTLPKTSSEPSMPKWTKEIAEQYKRMGWKTAFDISTEWINKLNLGSPQEKDFQEALKTIDPPFVLDRDIKIFHHTRGNRIYYSPNAQRRIRTAYIAILETVQEGEDPQGQRATARRLRAEKFRKAYLDDTTKDTTS